MLSSEASSTEGASRGVTPLDYEIRETKEQIELLKKKHAQGEVDDDSYKDLSKDLQKQLLKLEAKKND